MNPPSSNRAQKLDYDTHPVMVNDPDCGDSWTSGSDCALTDGLGADRYPAAWTVWTRTDAPAEGKPAIIIFDYSEPIRAAALAHYFYVPGSRDHRWKDYLAGPAAFGEVKVYAGGDLATWEEVAHHTDLPAQCPQVIEIPEPVSARYLKLEIISLAPGAPEIRSYEIETYTGAVPTEVDLPNDDRAARRGFPGLAGFEPESADLPVELHQDRSAINLTLPGNGGRPLPCRLEARIDNNRIVWDGIDNGRLSASVGEGRLEMDLRPGPRGIFVGLDWSGPVEVPFRKLELLAGMQSEVAEWCIPAYHCSRAQPEPISIASSVVSTCAAIVSDGESALTIVPDTDQSWVGLDGDRVTAAFPLTGERCEALVLASDGGWFSGFQRAAGEAFGFDEVRQFSPVSEAVPELCKYLLQPALWSEKHRMLRSFPDTDFFYIFYSLPYAVPALTMWESMSGDRSTGEKIDDILRFTLDRRLKEGPMAGSLFSEYADRELVERNGVPFGYSPFYTWHVNYPHEQLVGMDQGCSRWITSHNMGAVLWTITYVWMLRGALDEPVLAGAKDIADWMVRMQREDGSWAYAYHEDGTEASPMSDSGTIWNIWSLWRFGRLTGDSRYLETSTKAEAYFRETFTANHLYRGYWEDIYGGGKTELNSAQGYESAIAAIAFAEMGDSGAAVSSAQDALRFICTRQLESRDYWTSCGGVSEQQNWAPGTYIAPTFGYAAHLAWRQSGDDFFRPFASIAKTIGWWQDESGGAFWLSAAISQQPIEHLRESGGGRQFWALWDSAQKVTFSVPWLVDEVNRRTGDRMKLSTASLRGADDRGAKVSVRVFDGQVESASGQVNWLGLQTQARGQEYQLVLMNHAEPTACTVRAPFEGGPISARMFDASGAPTEVTFSFEGGAATIDLPERATAVLVWA